MLKALLFISAISAPFAQAQAPTSKKHSELVTSAKVDQNNVSLTFKVVPGQDMIVNFDAPWKLEITKADGLSFAKQRYERADMDDKLPGYIVTSAAAASTPSGDVTYKAIVFVCDKDKTRCFREVHDGTVSWKKSELKP